MSGNRGTSPISISCGMVFWSLEAGQVVREGDRQQLQVDADRLQVGLEERRLLGELRQRGLVAHRQVQVVTPAWASSAFACPRSWE